MTSTDSPSQTQLTVADVSVGDDLPVMGKNASRAQLFLYSAASFNPHRIHYDRDYAAVEGHADILVHGPLQGSWLTQYLTDWIGPRGRLRQVSWQNRASAFPEQDLEFHGRVTAVDTGSGEVELEVWEQTAVGQVLMPATATVVLPTT
jgi:hydroxyacyl-ACP dehydratase HTD2-like protein with hotdog domain